MKSNTEYLVKYPPRPSAKKYNWASVMPISQSEYPYLLAFDWLTLHEVNRLIDKRFKQSALTDALHAAVDIVQTPYNCVRVPVYRGLIIVTFKRPDRFGEKWYADVTTNVQVHWHDRIDETGAWRRALSFDNKKINDIEAFNPRTVLQKLQDSVHLAMNQVHRFKSFLPF